MHCHLGFLANAPAFAQEAERLGMGFFSATVTPAEFARMRDELAACPNVRVGAGLHPWWIDSGACDVADVEALCTMAAGWRYVGEIGLDFGKRREGSREAQMQAFERIAGICGQEGGKLLTVHAVRSADAALDVLERTGCLTSCDVIFHWFSDTNAALTRAVRAGCWFSVNARMLATKRGREYARAIPAGRLLLETDLPPESEPSFTLEAWRAELQGTLETLERLRARNLGQQLAHTSAYLLGWS